MIPPAPATSTHGARKGGPFDAVVIGTSAGGVEALQRLLAGLPAGFDKVVLVVIHLRPDRPSGMAELMARCCVLPVQEALDKQPLRRGTVVFAPPDYHLLVEPDQTAALSVDEPVLFSRPAIDPLFESAAPVFGARLLAVLLTGASDDGTAGVAAVRRHGGTVWIQDPAEAAAARMPRSALDRAGADEVLPLADICSRLAVLHPA